jgi:hypothetical protein
MKGSVEPSNPASRRPGRNRIPSPQGEGSLLGLTREINKHRLGKRLEQTCDLLVLAHNHVEDLAQRLCLLEVVLADRPVAVVREERIIFIEQAAEAQPEDGKSYVSPVDKGLLSGPLARRRRLRLPTDRDLPDSSRQRRRRGTEASDQLLVLRCQEPGFADTWPIPRRS